MEMEHALIVAKSYFPDAHVVTYKNGDSYYVTGRPPRSITGNPKIDNLVPDIIVVFHENASERDGMCWCPAYKNELDWWKPVESLSEKEWIKQLKEEMKDLKGFKQLKEEMKDLKGFKQLKEEMKDLKGYEGVSK